MQRFKMTDVKKEEPVVCPPGGMTADEYRTRAKEMVDYIANYLDSIRSRRVFPDVQPGYMQQLVPDTAPNRPEPWSRIMQDVERVIMPGVTHWQSPSMHAYFPALNCYPSLLGDMLADAINCLGFTWASSPACTELETIVMDWLGKMIGLPPSFLHGDNKMGGGCIQTTASDCTFVTLLAARADAIKSKKIHRPNLDDSAINGRLIGYCSDQAHSSVEKAGLIGLVKMRFLPSDENLSLRGDTLHEAVLKDKEKGLIPFYVCATLGTTGACAFDNLREVGLVCHSEKLWLHVDAAYAGSAFICPEYRTFMTGVEYADSFAFNPSKWLMVHFDCSAMWVKDARALHRTFNVEPLYLQHENSGAAIDYMHWQIALSRRFRSLKLWFVLRTFGVEGLQAHIRRGVAHAIHFENLLRSDRRFIVAAKRYLGMVVFRIDGPNQLTEALLKRLNKEGRIHMVPASLKGVYVIRFTVTSQFTTKEDIDRDWQVILDMTTQVLNEARASKEESIMENDEDFDDDDDDAHTFRFEGDGAPNGFHDSYSEFDDSGKHLRLTDERSTLSKGHSVDSSTTPRAGTSVSGKSTLSKTAAIKRREYGISLLLSNVPMSPKIVNGSFAAMFDDASTSIDLDQLCRQLTVGGEYIRLSPRKRSMLGDSDRQMSLDYGVLSASRKQCPVRMKLMGSLDSKIDDILDELGSSSSEKKNGRTNDPEEGEMRCEKDDVSSGTKTMSKETLKAPERVNGGSPRSPRITVKAAGAKETHASATSGGGVQNSPARGRKAMGVKIHMSTEGVDGKEKVDIFARTSPGEAWDQIDKETSTDLSLTAEFVGYCPHCGRGEDMLRGGDGLAV